MHEPRFSGQGEDGLSYSKRRSTAIDCTLCSRDRSSDLSTPRLPRPARAEDSAMIRRLELTNFKAFSRAQLNFAPLTLLLGPNNSGKSSLIAPLRLLTQTVESYDQRVALLLNGSFGDFGTFKDLVHGNHRGRPLGLSLEIDVSESRFGSRLDAATARIALEFKHRVKRRETVLRKVSVQLDDRHLCTLQYSKDSNRHSFSRVLRRTVPPHMKATLGKYVRMRHFLPQAFLMASLRDSGEVTAEFLTEETRDAIRRASSAANVIGWQLSEVEYVGAMREPPHRTYLFSGEMRQRVGASGEFAASLFMLDTMRRGRARRGLQKLVSDWLRRADIADEVFIDMISDRHYEVRVRHAVTGEDENFSDVGYGTSQIFPVLVAGYLAQEGTVLAVEEPEIHLHPRAQSELGDFFVDLSNRGVQSIVETHSEYLVLRLQRHVAEGALAPDDVAVYYIQPEPTGRKRIERLRLDSAGRFIDKWPQGFFPERLAEARGLSRARMTDASS